MRKLADSALGHEDAMALLKGAMEGWDIDPGALETCRLRLEVVSRELGFLGCIPRLYQRDALVDHGQRFDLVVGNPPYLEAKRMPNSLKRHVKSCCPIAARGAFDMYSAFVERAFRVLSDDGELCFIIPNRMLVVGHAAALRALLLESSLVRVMDLSTLRVFEDASVYPIILLARKGSERGYLVEEWDKKGDAVHLPVASVLAETAGMMPLPPRTTGGRQLFQRALTSGDFRPLKEIVAVRWCVSFHRAGLRDEFTFDGPPPNPTGRPMKFLGGGRFRGNREVQPYRITWGGWWIDYDEARARRERNHLPPLEIFKPPKVVVCQNARRARVALDRLGYVLKDTFLSLRCLSSSDEKAGWLEWITLVLNSRLFHYLYEHFYGGTRRGGGYLHFLPRYLGPFPFADLPTWLDVREVHDSVAAGETSPAQVDALVERAWGLTGPQRRVLDDYHFPRP